MTTIHAGIFHFALGIHGGCTCFALHAYGHFTQRIDAFSDGMDVEFQKRAGDIDDLIDGFIGRIDRTCANGNMCVNDSIWSTQADGGSGHAHRATGHLQAIEQVHIARFVEFVGNQGFKVEISDDLLAVGEVLEACKGFIELNIVEGMTHFGKAVAQRGTTRMFAQHKVGLIHADIFRAHDLIRALVFEHAILMNARFMCEGIRTNDGFVRLHHDARVIADKLGNARELRRFDTSF